MAPHEDFRPSEAFADALFHPADHQRKIIRVLIEFVDVSAQSIAAAVAAQIRTVNRIHHLLHEMGNMKIAPPMLMQSVQDDQNARPLPFAEMVKHAEQLRFGISGRERLRF